MHHDLNAHQFVEAGPHSIIALMLRERPAYLREGDFPLGVRMGHTPAIVRVLKQQILNSAISRLKLVRSGDLDQLARLGKACIISFLGDGKTHFISYIRNRTTKQVWSELSQNS
jgi:hypothetical protein